MNDDMLSQAAVSAAVDCPWCDGPAELTEASFICDRCRIALELAADPKPTLAAAA